MWITVMGVFLISGIAYGGYILSNPTSINDNGSSMDQSNDDGEDMTNYTDTSVNNTTSEDTSPKLTGSITINSIGTFSFQPKDIITVRPDIFKEGYFSLFDILVYLDNTSQIDMEYHFNESMNTFIIETINNIPNWRYRAYYSGGWWEDNVFRMDHYPYKDKTTIRLETTGSIAIDAVYTIWKDEVDRKINNDGRIIIPRVTIWGPPGEGYLEFNDVTVTAHNLRNDMFQEGVITAIDTILSLADQRDITYGLKWYESIGIADIVKTYYVEQVNEWQAYETCGFVYESGSEKYESWQGNHIHIPSDTRVINSPEYVLYFWICL